MPFARLETQTRVRPSAWLNTGPTHQRRGEPYHTSPPSRLLQGRASGHPVMVNKGVSCFLCYSFFRSLGMSELGANSHRHSAIARCTLGVIQSLAFNYSECTRRKLIGRISGIGNIGGWHLECCLVPMACTAIGRLLVHALSFPPATFLSFTHHHPSFPSPQIIMSASPSASTSQSNFVAIYNAALESYKRKTKKDLASHPLLPSLQSCDSAEAILTVLRDQIPAFSQSQNGDDGLTKWVAPTVNVLYAFSATLGQGIGIVNITMFSREEYLL